VPERLPAGSPLATRLVRLCGRPWALLADNSERSAHEGVDAAVVGVGSGREVRRGVPAQRVGRRRAVRLHRHRVGAELSRVELGGGGRVREREGDAGAPVARDLTGGDRVPFVAGVVLIDEYEAVALANRRYAGARLTEQAEVAGHVGVSLDPDLRGEWAVREFAHVDHRGRRAAVD